MLDRITRDSTVIVGQVCIRGMRLRVKQVVPLIAEALGLEDLCFGYPRLDDEDIRQSLEYAASCIEDHFVSAPLLGSS